MSTGVSRHRSSDGGLKGIAYDREIQRTTQTKRTDAKHYSPEPTKPPIPLWLLAILLENVASVSNYIVVFLDLGFDVDIGLRELGRAKLRVGINANRRAAGRTAH